MTGAHPDAPADGTPVVGGTPVGADSPAGTTREPPGTGAAEATGATGATGAAPEHPLRPAMDVVHGLGTRAGRAWVEWRRPIAIAAGGTALLRVVVGWVSLVNAYGVDFPHVVARNPSVLTGVLAHWDAGYYLALAQHGYASAGAAGAGAAGAQGYAFAPLFPGLTSLVHEVTRRGFVMSSELVALAGTFVAVAVVWKLVAERRGSRAAGTAVVLLLAWPSAFFLVAPYPESVSLAAVACCLLAVRRRRWLLAGLLAAAASMGKYYLVLLVVVLAIEVWGARSGGPGHARTRWALSRRDLGRLGAVVLPAVGAVVGWILYQQAQFGDGFAFVHAESGPPWHRQLAGPWVSLVDAGSDLVHLRFLDTSTASVVELFDIVTVVLLAIAAVYLYVSVRRSYGVLLGLVWCVFTFETFLLSESREVLVLAPFFVALGVWAGRRLWRERLLLFLFLPAGYFLLARFVTGRFAG